MITAEQYFAAVGGPFGHGVTQEHRDNAAVLLRSVIPCLLEVKSLGADLDVNPQTRCLIAGSRGGGFRSVMINSSQTLPRPNSTHLTGEGVDIYDPDGDIDEALTDEILEKHGLYREHPSATRTWCHLQTRPPKSGRRSYYP